jgi:hypothetical protein
MTYASYLVAQSACYMQNDRGIGVQFLAGGKDFVFSTTSRPALGSNQAPIE